MASAVRPAVRVASHHRTHIVFGANTDVGKTLISAGLVRSCLQQNNESIVHYIKPLQCGGSDETFVKKHASGMKNLQTQTLFSWDTPASPHHASRIENLPKSDDEVKNALFLALEDISSSTETPKTTCWIETAGGVLSPSSASPDNRDPQHARGSKHDDDSFNSWGWSTQGDLYQHMAGLIPVVLVGDGRLGGISATLSALESLCLRGYNVAGIVLLETGYDNRSALREYASRKIQPKLGGETALFSDPEGSIVSLPSPPPIPAPLDEWYESAKVSDTLDCFNQVLEDKWRDHVAAMQETDCNGRDGHKTVIL